jgi:hypothetical protein
VCIGSDRTYAGLLLDALLAFGADDAFAADDPDGFEAGACRRATFAAGSSDVLVVCWCAAINFVVKNVGIIAGARFSETFPPCCGVHEPLSASALICFLYPLMVPTTLPHASHGLVFRFFCGSGSIWGGRGWRARRNGIFEGGFFFTTEAAPAGAWVTLNHADRCTRSANPAELINILLFGAQTARHC